MYNDNIIIFIYTHIKLKYIVRNSERFSFCLFKLSKGTLLTMQSFTQGSSKERLYIMESAFRHMRTICFILKIIVLL